MGTRQYVDLKEGNRVICQGTERKFKGLTGTVYTIWTKDYERGPYCVKFGNSPCMCWDFKREELRKLTPRTSRSISS